MKINTILIRYNEIALKGGNRSKFEKRLVANIKFALKKKHPELQFSMKKADGRIYVEDVEWSEDISKTLAQVYGVFSFSPAVKLHGNIELIKNTAYELTKNILPGKKTFCVRTSRPNKRFEMKSLEVDREVGGFVKSHYENLSVSIKNPEVTIGVEIRGEGIYVYAERIPARKGLPYGTNGKGLVLISGGIDSPVAAHLAHKRGLQTSYIYFHSYPYTSNEALDKVKNLVKIVCDTLPRQRLYMVNFTAIQEAIKEHCFENYRIVLYRRMMMRIAEKIAEKEEINMLITGENLGQVASQTVHNMFAIDNATNLLVIRPLVTFDKVEIVDIAKEIGTYETSILPYPDSCTVFMPENPIINADMKKVLGEENKINVDKLIEETLPKIEIFE